MKATLFIIENDRDHAQARALIEKLMGSSDVADQPRMTAQASASSAARDGETTTSVKASRAARHEPACHSGDGIHQLSDSCRAKRRTTGDHPPSE